MKKKLLSILLVLAMVSALLMACSGGSSDSADAEPAEETAEVAEDTAEEPADDAEPATAEAPAPTAVPSAPICFESAPGASFSFRIGLVSLCDGSFLQTRVSTPSASVVAFFVTVHAPQL